MLALLHLYPLLHPVLGLASETLRGLLQLFLLWKLTILRFSHLLIEFFHALGYICALSIETHVQVLAPCSFLFCTGAIATDRWINALVCIGLNLTIASSSKWIFSIVIIKVQLWIWRRSRWVIDHVGTDYTCIRILFICPWAAHTRRYQLNVASTQIVTHAIPDIQAHIVSILADPLMLFRAILELS